MVFTLLVEMPTSAQHQKKHAREEKHRRQLLKYVEVTDNEKALEDADTAVLELFEQALLMGRPIFLHKAQVQQKHGEH